MGVEDGGDSRMRDGADGYEWRSKGSRDMTESTDQQFVWLRFVCVKEKKIIPLSGLCFQIN